MFEFTVNPFTCNFKLVNSLFINNDYIQQLVLLSTAYRLGLGLHTIGLYFTTGLGGAVFLIASKLPTAKNTRYIVTGNSACLYGFIGFESTMLARDLISGLQKPCKQPPKSKTREFEVATLIYSIVSSLMQLWVCESESIGHFAHLGGFLAGALYQIVLFWSFWLFGILIWYENLSG